MHPLSRLRPGVPYSGLLVGIAECVRAENPLSEEPLPARLADLAQELEELQAEDVPSTHLPGRRGALQGYPFPGIPRA